MKQQTIAGRCECPKCGETKTHHFGTQGGIERTLIERTYTPIFGKIKRFDVMKCHTCNYSWEVPKA